MANVSSIQKQLEKASGKRIEPQPAAVVTAAPVNDFQRPPSREGKVHIGAYLHPGFKSSLRMVQAQTGKDIQALLAHALNELFRAHNVPVVDHK
jgi:hypothetical protein